MTEISKRINVLQALSPYKLGIDYLAFVDSTIARFWFTNSNIEQKITNLLQKISDGHLLNSDDKSVNHLNFSDYRYGKEIFVANPGVQFFPNFLEPRRSLLGKLNKGLHGYLPKHPSTKGIFLYSGSLKLDIKDSVQVVEILPIIKSLLNVDK